MEFPAFRTRKWIQQQLDDIVEDSGTNGTDNSAPKNDPSRLTLTTNDLPNTDGRPQDCNSISGRLITPSSVLKDANLFPTYMLSFETIGLYPKKVQAIRETLRRTLFRQALFKIQNVEVMHMKKCKSNRILKEINKKDILSRIFPFQRSKTQSLFYEELWKIDRCGHEVLYKVQYFNEDGNGFSTRVVPQSLFDKWKAFQYYFL